MPSNDKVDAADKASKIAKMQEQLDAIQNEQQSLESQIAALPRKFDTSVALPTDRLASQATPDEVERAQVLRDPWAGQNALQILRHPPGKRLQWINPQYREKRGMRGWNPVRYDDAIGRELHLYINDPPSRMEGLMDIGQVVRRGDVVLAWIDEGIFQARIARGQERAHRGMKSGAARDNKKFGAHGKTFGRGLEDDPDPKYRRARPAPGFISPQRLEEYRQAAVGTVNDPRITVEGRRLFDEPRAEDENTE